MYNKITFKSMYHQDVKYYMKAYFTKFELSIPIEIFQKLSYIANHRGWSVNRLINRFMKNEIAVFERKHGKIHLSDDNDEKSV